MLQQPMEFRLCNWLPNRRYDIPKFLRLFIVDKIDDVFRSIIFQSNPEQQQHSGRIALVSCCCWKRSRRTLGWTDDSTVLGSIFVIFMVQMLIWNSEPDVTNCSPLWQQYSRQSVTCCWSFDGTGTSHSLNPLISCQEVSEMVLS